MAFWNYKLSSINVVVATSLVMFPTCQAAANELGSCPTGWARDGETCYGMLPGDPRNNTADHAAEVCRQHGGTLMNLYRKDMNDMATQILYGSRGLSAVIGLNDRDVEGLFRWSDGKLAHYVNWDSGAVQPASPEDADCAIVDIWGKWLNIDCSEHRRDLNHIACEKRR